MARGSKSAPSLASQLEAMSALDTYRQAAELTRLMREAARQHDWDDVTTAGNARDALLVSAPPRLLPANAAENLELQELIRDMLACHEEISAHAGPWLKHTAGFLAALDRSEASKAE